MGLGAFHACCPQTQWYVKRTSTVGLLASSFVCQVVLSVLVTSLCLASVACPGADGLYLTAIRLSGM